MLARERERAEKRGEWDDDECEVGALDSPCSWTGKRSRPSCPAQASTLRCHTYDLHWRQAPPKACQAHDRIISVSETTTGEVVSTHRKGNPSPSNISTCTRRISSI